MMKPVVSLIVLTLFLSGCSLAPNKPNMSNAVSWEVYQEQALALENYLLTGKVGIRSAEDSNSATLTWAQNGQEFDIRLKGPLGQGAAAISGDQYYATLEIPNEPPLQAATPEELLDLRLGWALPVREAQYWIKGIPAPGSTYDATFDDNKLATLQQQGWDITYDRYLEQANQTLPGKVVFTRGELVITIIVRSWQKSG
jgi:outer membrane lipoprotein LolB